MEFADASADAHVHAQAEQGRGQEQEEYDPSLSAKYMIYYIDNCRVLSAKEEYDKLMKYINENKKSASTEKGKWEDYEVLLDDNKAKIDKMLRMHEEVDHIIRSAFDSDKEGWIHGTHYFGIQTDYKVGSDNIIEIKMEGVQEDLPIFEQISVIYETSLMKEWVPFCNASRLLHQIDTTELVSYIKFATPFGVSRDLSIHAYGVDCMYEKGCIVISAKSIDEYEGIDIPPNDKGFFHDRADMKFLGAVIQVISPTSAKTTYMVKMDPKIHMPHWIINFITRQVAGMFLYCMQSQAQKIKRDVDSIYRQQIKQNPQFYVQWLLPRIRAYIQHMGWEQAELECLGSDGIPIPNHDYIADICFNNDSK